ncbi:MAG: hypothetical protein IPP44_09150 [Ideonella sp.]|jgi:hypothetical protein|nr:hypothetical protein [Ideonella sp.]
MTTTKISQQIASFTFAVVMTVGVLFGLNGLAASEASSAQQLASTISAARV